MKRKIMAIAIALTFVAVLSGADCDLNENVDCEVFCF